jgi:hypothetical protein
MKNWLFLVLILIGNGAFAKTSKVAPVPRQRPVFKYYYYYTRADVAAPIIDDLGKTTELPPETMIRLAVSPKRETNTPETLIWFDTIPQSPTEKLIRGKISVEYVGQAVSSRPSWANFKKFLSIVRTENERPRLEREYSESQWSVKDVLWQFHNTDCATGGRSQSEEELKLRWQHFIDNRMLSERGKQLAQNARALDFAARTVLFEAQRKEQLPKDGHPKMEECQWDIIALSIRNRAFNAGSLSMVKNYGGEFIGDIVGVATDVQYNLWMKDHLARNSEILACFMNDGFTDKYAQRLFARVLNVIPKTIGIDQDDQPMKKTDISDRFQTIRKNQRFPEPQLRELTHYNHPCAAPARAIRAATSGAPGCEWPARP